MKVRAQVQGTRGTVLQMLFGDQYRVTVVCGFRVIIRKGKENLADEKVVLPANTKGPIAIEVLRAMERDKKKGPEGIRWVFLERIGKTTVVSKVARDVVRPQLRGFMA